jgi:KDO2-lipid IV(A) lauroyltransferase
MAYQKLKHWLTYIAVRLVVCIIQAIPLRLCQPFANWMAALTWRWLRFRRTVIDDNLRHAFPEMSAPERDAIGQGMWSHLVLQVCEIAHTARKVHRTNWRRHIRLSGERELVTRLLEQRPLVLLSGHFGNFELAGYAAGLYGFSNHSIARPLDNPYLNQFIGSFRRLNGQYILPKQGSAADIQQLLAGNGILAILGDQYAGRKGCWLDFLGRPASYHKSVALFALASRATLAACYARRLGNPLQFEIGLASAFDPGDPGEVPRDIPGITQWYNDGLESIVRRDPEQYWWVHRRWKGTPPISNRTPALSRSA